MIGTVKKVIKIARIIAEELKIRKNYENRRTIFV